MIKKLALLCLDISRMCKTLDERPRANEAAQGSPVRDSPLGATVANELETTALSQTRVKYG